MSTMDDDWWLTEAGEYVLGTLRGTERDLFEKVLERDADARAQVDYWESQFEAIELALQKAEYKTHPGTKLPDRIWDEIKQAVEQEPVASASAGMADRHSGSAAASANGNLADVVKKNNVVNLAQSGQLIPPKIQLRRWRALAGAAIAASLAMGTVLLQPQLNPFQPLPVQPGADQTAEVRSPGGYNVVSVLRDDAGNDLWAILAETATGRISAIALQTPAKSVEHSHQLWVVLPEDKGVQSVGLLPYGNGRVGIYELPAADAQANLESGAAFAVSREPAGGTKELSPTGPVISARPYTRLESDI